jgi:hypothetical protein
MAFTLLTTELRYISALVRLVVELPVFGRGGGEAMTTDELRSSASAKFLNFLAKASWNS